MKPTRPQRAHIWAEFLIVMLVLILIFSAGNIQYRQASTRSKVAETKQRLLHVAGALESYKADVGKYPTMHIQSTFIFPNLTENLTTPVAYLLPEELLDTFVRLTPIRINGLPVEQTVRMERYVFETATHPGGTAEAGLFHDAYSGSRYDTPGIAATGGFLVASVGPDEMYGPMIANRTSGTSRWSYDPTNGTISAGDIVRTARGGETTY